MNIKLSYGVQTTYAKELKNLKLWVALVYSYGIQKAYHKMT